MRNEILERDLGEWEAAVTVFAGPGAPATSIGHLSARLVAGGNWLVLDYLNPMSGFGGHGVYGWDEAAGHFVGTWVDNLTATLRILKGTHDPETGAVTYVGEIDGPQGRMELRQRTVAPEPDVRRFTSTIILPDGKEFVVMEAIYRRSVA